MIKINPNIFNGMVFAVAKMRDEFKPLADYMRFPFRIAHAAKNVEYTADNLLFYMHDFLHACQRYNNWQAMKEVGVSGRR